MILTETCGFNNFPWLWLPLVQLIPVLSPVVHERLGHVLKTMLKQNSLYFIFSILCTVFVSSKSLDQLRTVYDAGVQESSYGKSTDPFNPFLISHGQTVEINDFLVGVIENFREDMLTGIPELKVPILDPFKPKKPVQINVEDAKASVHGNFSDMLVEGLSGFVLEYLNADMQNLSLTFHLTIPHIRASGYYVLDGKILKIMPLRGNGTFWVESKNLSVAAKASIRSTDDNHLQLSDDIKVHMDFDKVEIYLENFLGGGRWTEILLKMLNDISKDLFKKSLPLLKNELNKSLLKVINKHLMKLPITSIIPGSTANEYIDQILLNVQNYIKVNKLEPMALPDYIYNFTKEVMYITFKGEAKLYNGLLSGISSLHRTDECDFHSNKTSISVAAHLGLNDLKVFYTGHAKFMSWGPTIQAGGNVKSVSFYFKINQSIRKGSKPVLQEFEIVEMSTIWVEMSGLGPLTWLMKWMITGITKLMEDFIVEKLTSYLSEYMQEEFNKFAFPI